MVRILMENSPFQLWMRDCHILRFLSARVLVAEVIAGLLMVERNLQQSVKF